MSVSLWEAKQLIPMRIAPCGRDVPSVRSRSRVVFYFSQVLSAVSLDPTIVCCAGGSVDLIKTLDKDTSQKAGKQYPLSLLLLQIEKLMHKPSFSVKCKIDMFSMVRTLLLIFSSLMDERWTQSMQHLRIVRWLCWSVLVGIGNWSRFCTIQSWCSGSVGIKVGFVFWVLGCARDVGSLATKCVLHW